MPPLRDARASVFCRGSIPELGAKAITVNRNGRSEFWGGFDRLSIANSGLLRNQDTFGARGELGRLLSSFSRLLRRSVGMSAEMSARNTEAPLGCATYHHGGVEPSVQRHGSMPTTTDTTLVILCPYCLLGIEHRPMIAYKDGRFVCRDCAHTVRPGVVEYRCSCRPCLSLWRQPSPSLEFLP